MEVNQTVIDSFLLFNSTSTEKMLTEENIQ